MGIKKGSSDVLFRLGSREVLKIYKGSSVVWEKPTSTEAPTEEPPEDDSTNQETE